MTRLYDASLTEVAARIRRRELSPVELVEATLARIESLEPELHAFARVLPEAALEAARRAEAAVSRSEAAGPLCGVPIGVKDLCFTKGVPTAAGTRVLRDFRPDHDATVVERLEAAGAVIVGKLQLTEGAYGWHHPDVEPPRNPWNPERWTGVSSSGSGVATAAGLCFGSLGSDTGGSIRFPSACCNLVGLKPTYGRVSRYGVFPLAHSLDHVGPMARTAADTAALLQVLAGYDARDPTSLRAPVPDYTAALDGGVRGVRIGVDPEASTRGVDPEVRACIDAAAATFRELGAEVREVALPPAEALVVAWVGTTAVECTLAHAETFPSRADDYGPELRALLELGSGLSAANYARAEIERAAYRARLTDLFESVDLLLIPAMPTPPPEASGIPASIADAAPLIQFTAPFDYSGSPTLSLPGGACAQGPLGFQLVGRSLEEALLLRAGQAYQSATDWHTRRPPLSAKSPV